MIANLLVLLLVVGLAVLFAWLCYRAIRAQKLWVKIVGGIGFAVLTLLFLFVAFNETMPWQVAAQLTDDDMAALHAYLTAPVQ